MLRHMPAVVCFGFFHLKCHRFFVNFLFFFKSDFSDKPTAGRHDWAAGEWGIPSRSMVEEKKQKQPLFTKRSIYVVYFLTTSLCITSSNLAQMIWHLGSCRTCLYCTILSETAHRRGGFSRLPPSSIALQKKKEKKPQHPDVTWFWKTELLLRSAASFMQVDS